MTSRLHRLSRPAALGAALFVALMCAIPALAADPTFPVGSRIGLVPPGEMTASKTFMGFEDRTRNAAILLSTFPPDAFPHLDSSMAPDALKKQNITIDKREPFDVAGQRGFLLSGQQTINNAPYRKYMLVVPAGNVTALVTVQVPDQDATYSDKAVHDALATLVARPVPDAENLSLLPFAIDDLAGFRIDDVLPGRAVMLVEGSAATAVAPAPADNAPGETKAGDTKAGDSASDAAVEKAVTAANSDHTGHPITARLLVAAVPGGPADLKDAGEFARRTFEQIGGLEKVRIQDMEPLRMGGLPGYETLANAVDPLTGGELRVVQWLRFGSGVYIQMVGVARADGWIDAFARMRKVRDSVMPR